MLFEEIPDLSPVQFFALSWDCPHVKGKLRAGSDYKIPSTAEFLNEDAFAEIYMGWNEQKVMFEVNAKGRTEADSVELFFDTRDLKTKAQVSKFCHHFIFTPDADEGVHGREITRFSGDDIHRLCDSEELAVEVKSGADSYAMKIEIPADCLHGYDPLQFQRMGFTYRINRGNRPSQHFAVSSEEYAIEKHPSLWATVRLIGGK